MHSKFGMAIKFDLKYDKYSAAVDRVLILLIKTPAVDFAMRILPSCKELLVN